MDEIAAIPGDLAGCTGVRSRRSDGDYPGDDEVTEELPREPDPPRLWIVRFLGSRFVRDLVLLAILVASFWGAVLLSELLVHLNNK